VKAALVRVALGVAALPAVAAHAQETAAGRPEMVIEHLKKAAATISADSLRDVRSLEDWKRQRPGLRGELLYMLGLDPLPARTPLLGVKAELLRAPKTPQSWNRFRHSWINPAIESSLSYR